MSDKPITHSHLNDVGVYLADHAMKGTTPPEGSFTRVVNRLPPAEHGAARAVLAAYDHARTGGGATMPFARRYTVDDVNEHFGLDPDASREIHQRMYDENITAGLMERMGDDRSRPLEPATLREQVAAALDTVVGSDQE